MRTDGYSAPFGELLQVKLDGSRPGRLTGMTVNPRGLPAEELFGVEAEVAQKMVASPLPHTL